MSATQIAMLLAMLPLLGISGAISATETALFSLGYTERTRLRRLHPAAAASVDRLLSHPRALLVTVLMVNNLVNVTYFVIVSVLSQSFDRAAVSVAISLGALLVLVVCAEVMPKLMARANPGNAARWLAPPFVVISAIVRPVRRVLDAGLISPLVRLIQPRHDQKRAASAEELSALLDLSRRSGHIAPTEQRLLAEVVELGSIRVREVMTPRVDIQAVEESARAPHIQRVARETGHDAIPVVRGGLDGEVLGILDVPAFLLERSVRPGAEARLTGFVRPALFVPDTARLDQLLEEFRRAGGHQAMVVNEFGALVGLVELQDVVRELVRIPDQEEDQVNEQVRLVEPGVWNVGGRLPVRELMEFFLGPAAPGQDPARQATTVGGLVLLLLGRIPKAGDTVTFGNLRMQVASVRGRVVETVRLEIGEPSPRGSGA
jgi:putative hemolysin